MQENIEGGRAMDLDVGIVKEASQELVMTQSSAPDIDMQSMDGSEDGSGQQEKEQSADLSEKPTQATDDTDSLPPVLPPNSPLTSLTSLESDADGVSDMDEDEAVPDGGQVVAAEDPVPSTSSAVQGGAGNSRKRAGDAGPGKCFVISS